MEISTLYLNLSISPCSSALLTNTCDSDGEDDHSLCCEQGLWSQAIVWSQLSGHRTPLSQSLHLYCIYKNLLGRWREWTPDPTGFSFTSISPSSLCFNSSSVHHHLIPCQGMAGAASLHSPDLFRGVGGGVSFCSDK